MTIEEKKIVTRDAQASLLYIHERVSQLANMLSQIDYHLYEDNENADKYIAKSGLNNFEYTKNTISALLSDYESSLKKLSEG